MKNVKKIIAMLLAVIMMSLSFVSISVADVDADELEPARINGELAQSIINEGIVTKTKFSQSVLLIAYADNRIGYPETKNLLIEKASENDLSKAGTIKLKSSINGYNSETQAFDGSDHNALTVKDAQTILMLAASWESQQGRAKKDGNTIKEDIASELGITTGDVDIISTVSVPQKMLELLAEKYHVDDLTSYKVFRNGSNEFQITKDSTQEQINEYFTDLKTLETKVKSSDTTNNGTKFFVVSVQAIATTPNEIITYDLTLGNDENWYLIKSKEEEIPDKPTPEDPIPEDPTPEDPTPEDPTPEDPKAEFATIMDYTAIDENGKKVEAKERKNETDPFLAPYYENEDKDAHKDTDVIVTIKSKTDEEIAQTNGIALRNDGKANNEGWYYPDVKDKKVIAKKYLFDDYDNTTDNGMVSETVKLTGAEGGEDTQKPSIIWTFRRIDITETKNTDESITVVITYNLPVDKDSIPADWKPIYDKDGKTIHKITKTIKKGEDYDKDVKVKQNGTDKTVTTKVKYTWPKEETKIPEDNTKTPEKTLPQTGGNLIIAFVILVTIAVAVISYKKFRKLY